MSAHLLHKKRRLPLRAEKGHRHQCSHLRDRSETQMNAVSHPTRAVKSVTSDPEQGQVTIPGYGLSDMCDDGRV